MRTKSWSRRAAAVLVAAVALTAPAFADAAAEAVVTTPGSAAVRSAGPKHVDPATYLTYRDKDGHYFRWSFSSASGAIRCTVAQYEDSAPWGCFAAKRTWRDPVLPPGGYGLSCSAYGSARLKGALFADRPGSRFVVLCKDELPDVTRRGKTLPAGSVITVNGITCASTVAKGQESIRCAAAEGGSFTMSRTRLTFRQVPPQ